MPTSDEVRLGRRAAAAVLLLSLLAPLAGPATRPATAALSWAFTYQGELNQSGAPLNGAADLAFRLFDAATSGAQVGATVNAPATPMAHGRFTVELDFTAGGTLAGVFDGNERWLEIAVNGTTLSPRQRVSVTPHAAVASILALPSAMLTTAPVALQIVSQSQAAQVRVVRAETQSEQIGAIAVMGQAFNTNDNENVGVYGESNSGNGFGVVGVNTDPAGNSTGVYGHNYSSQGIGVYGHNSSATGETRGVFGKVDSPDGWAGYFEGRGFFSNKVGIRTIGAPGAMLDVQGGDPATGLALRVNDELYVDHLDDFVGVHRDLRVTPNEVFGVRANVGGTGIFGGMYVETAHPSGLPFYGYATDGNPKAWTYFDGVNNRWHLTLNGSERISVDSSGRTGIGRFPTANALEVSGSASKTTAGQWLANSDARIKTGVRTLTGALDKLDEVRLVGFHYTEAYRAAHPEIVDREYLNVIAQEFAQAFPDHVQPSGEKLPDGSDILQVDTWPLTIYAAAAVKELHGVVRNQDARIAAQAAEIADLRGRLARLEGGLAAALEALAGAPVARPASLGQ